LVQRTEPNGERGYRYQARFKRTTLVTYFVLTSEDKISVMMPEKVKQITRSTQPAGRHPR
jgi:hypothetical protein